jgi:hypothetical protein
MGDLMKKLERKGYTNGVKETVLDGDDFNRTSVQFCTVMRYKKCVMKNACSELEPRCMWDEFKLAGEMSESTKGFVSKQGKELIKKRLSAAVKQCKPVTVVVSYD